MLKPAAGKLQVWLEGSWFGLQAQPLVPRAGTVGALRGARRTVRGECPGLPATGKRLRKGAQACGALQKPAAGLGGAWDGEGAPRMEDPG